MRKHQRTHVKTILQNRQFCLKTKAKRKRQTETEEPWEVKRDSSALAAPPCAVGVEPRTFWRGREDILLSVVLCYLGACWTLSNDTLSNGRLSLQICKAIALSPKWWGAVPEAGPGFLCFLWCVHGSLYTQRCAWCIHTGSLPCGQTQQKDGTGEVFFRVENLMSKNEPQDIFLK